MCLCMLVCVKWRVCLGTVTSKTGRLAVQPLRSKGGGSLRQLCFSLVYEVLLGFIRKNALGTVCSLLCPGCDSGFDRDDANAKLTSEACNVLFVF